MELEIKDEEKTKEQLISELEDLRRRIAGIGGVPRMAEPRRKNGRFKEEKIRADDERARTEGIIAAIGDGLRIINPDFRIVYENQRHKELLGDHAGEYCYRAYRQRDQECEMCPLVVTFEEGLVHRTERVLQHATETRHLGITASPLRDASGKIVSAVVVVTDITARKRIEAEREQLIHDLQESFAKIKTLTGLIPTCAWCRKVRDGGGHWHKLEKYISENSDASFTHGICPECLKKTWPEIYDDIAEENGRQ